MYIDSDPDFDSNPLLFQLEGGMLLDLSTNTFRRTVPDDRTRRKSTVRVPERWLNQPSLIETEGKPLQELAHAVLWSMFARAGEHHPLDFAADVGDMDETQFRYLYRLIARMLEGAPLGLLVLLLSKRGRNSKGVIDKILRGLFGSYYVTVKQTVFMASKRNENDHSAAEVHRRGARICFCNEVCTEAFSNGVFKAAAWCVRPCRPQPQVRTTGIAVRGCKHIEQV